MTYHSPVLAAGCTSASGTVDAIPAPPPVSAAVVRFSSARYAYVLDWPADLDEATMLGGEVNC